MSQSLTQLLIHIIFSTKQRRPIILPDIEQKLYAYIIGIANEYKCQIYAIGGVEDHVHLLVSLSKTMTVSKFIEEIKKGSSKWIKTQGHAYTSFAWQTGYGAFSIGQSICDSVYTYIQNQKMHHKKISFQDEYRNFLKKYHIAYDEEYLWD